MSHGNGNGNGRGRPTIVPGERSVELRFLVGESSFRQLRLIAQRERDDLSEICRQAIANFIAEKLTAKTT